MSEQTESTPTTPARRVIVAEDETLIRLDIMEILRGEGYDVVGEADNGEKAVELAKEFSTDDSGAFVHGVLARVARTS